VYREEIFLDRIVQLAEKTEIDRSVAPKYEVTKKTDVWFLILPQWSSYLPPFSLARLSSILLQNGYDTRCIDLNIECFNILKPHFKDVGYNPWDGTWIFKWRGKNYFSELHFYFEDYFNKVIKKIIEAKPKVLGFSMYWTNTAASKWMIDRLRRELPDTIFIAGGPSSQSDLETLKSIFDVTVVGEAEKITLDILDSIEDGSIDKAAFPYSVTQPFKERLNLDQYPIPNFADFDPNLYIVPNGLVTEFSRGCVAKCTFCEETHFWNYRQRGYLSLVNEIQFLNKAYGFDSVWFIDSLINGSVKELEEFAKEIIKRDIKINFFGYARHDKRMNLEYLKLLAEAGLVAFQYGCESGSNKVLEDINKRVSKETMEQNFIDCAKVGIQSVTGWVIGFPTEEIHDFVDTLTLIWRNRNTSITNLVYSTRFHMNTISIVGQNPKKFGLKLLTYDRCWIRDDLTLGKPHLSLRAKCFQIFADLLQSGTRKKISHIPRPKFKEKGYKIKFNNIKNIKDVDWDNYKYFDIDTGNVWADSFMNEPLGLFRLLWRTRGGFSASIFFDSEVDKTEFGPSLHNLLNGRLDFKIDNAGNWQYNVDIDFTQQPGSWAPISKDFFFDLTDPEIRARKLAKLNLELSPEDYTKLRDDANNLNAELNLSFIVNKKFKGSWAKRAVSIL